MLHGRKRTATIVATLLALLTAVVGLGLDLAVSPSASARPDLATVKRQVAELDQQAEAASERYNDAKVKVAATRTKLDALDSDLKRQQSLVDGMRAQVASMIVDQYQGNALSMTSQVLLSDDPDVFLENLNAIASYNSQRGQAMKSFATELSRLQLRKAAVEAESGQLVNLANQMKSDKIEILAKAAKAHTLLNGLESNARARLIRVSRSAPRAFTGTLPDVPVSGRAAAAVQFAMAQVGKSYAYGATGPNSYDCSGLTMRAWGAAGVSLPHSSAAQMGSGARISESDLQPGDLVFYYSPVSHVGIYIGNGMIVNAENPRSGVRVTGLHSMPYVGAVRPG